MISHIWRVSNKFIYFASGVKLDAALSGGKVRVITEGTSADFRFSKVGFEGRCSFLCFLFGKGVMELRRFFHFWPPWPLNCESNLALIALLSCQESLTCEL